MKSFCGVVVATMVMAFGIVGVGGPVAGASAGGSFFGGQLFVSASRGSDAGPCTAFRPCRTIGHAVSVAPTGGTITALPGTYAESVTVTRRINLRSFGATVDATGQINGIAFMGPGTAGSTISGFTVENAQGEGVLVFNTSHVTLGWNQVRSNDRGSGTDVTTECQDQGEVPGDCGEGLHLMSVTDSRVLANRVEDNVGGILVTDEVGPSHGNLIAFNESRNNNEDCGITLPSHNGAALGHPELAGVYDNTVIANVSSGNGGAGVGMFAPFPGTASYDNRVIGNTLLNNGEAGIAIHAHAPGQNVSGNVIVNNVVSGNGIDPDSGSGHPTGIALFSAAVPVNVVVAGNRISNEFWGIFVNGQFSIAGLASNHYISVAHPVGP
ncbi:MAG TPA: NosD domain-containing protein [Acidimicrobiia bacterium]|jgi:nitrous oxidase accessory protein NosD